MPADIDAINALDWEAFPSTRVNTLVWTKWSPVDVTLTTPGTAQDLYTISTVIPTVNLAPNPSFETGAPPTGYTASGAALAQSAVVARTGSNSLRITPDNAAAGEGAYLTTDAIGGRKEHDLYLVASAYFNDNAGSGNGVRVIIADTSGVALATGNTVTLAANWTGRSTAAYKIPVQSNAQYRAYLVTATQFATVFYVDSLQLELRKSQFATDYCDGSLGNGYEWDGTANASTSRRRLGLSVIRGYRLFTTRDIYISDDVTASSTTGEFKRAGTDFWEDFPINTKKNISIINAVAGEQPRVYGKVYGVHVERQS